MKVFHIDQFKCTFCSNWFCPPFNLPYRLKCTHSICTTCLEKSNQNRTNQIICPQDLQRNKIDDIIINQSTKKALERLLKEHKNFTQTNDLQCIKSLSLTFDQLLDSKQIQLKNLSTLVDQIFENQIKRLREIYEKIKLQINRPFRVVNDWKQVVRNYLKKVKSQGPQAKGVINQLNHYIDEGRKIKLDLNQYLKYNFQQLIEYLLITPQVCFTHNFTIFNEVEQKIKQLKQMKVTQFKPSQYLRDNKKEIQLQDITNKFEQSSIRMVKNPNKSSNNSKKISLFEELVSETPKNNSKYFAVENKIRENDGQQITKQSFYSTKSSFIMNQQQKQSSNLKLKNQVKPVVSENQISSNIHYSLNPNYHQTKSTGYILTQDNQKAYQNQQQDEQSQSSYNQSIREKIKKLKTNQQTVIQPLTTNILTTNKKGDKTLLQYSPEYNEDILDNYSITQSDQKPVKTYNINAYECENSKRDSDYSLHSYYQQSTALMKQNKNHYQSQSDEDEENLLDQNSNRKHNQKQRNNWQLSNMNFLKQWKICKKQKQQDGLQIITRNGGFNCQKQKQRYMKKIEENRVRQLMEQMIIGDNYIELVGHSLIDCNVTLLLSQIEWSYRNIEIIKFIKCSLNDSQLNHILNFLLHSSVHTLMLSSNSLSQIALDALLNFVEMNDKLKNIYLPKNNISLLKGNARVKMGLLKQKGINLYI